MSDSVNKKELVFLLAARMDSDLKTASSWVDAMTETLYEAMKSGKSVTLPGLGGFYVKPKHPTWVFKFNPGQRLRALFGWSSTYKGKL
jgi:DNA-binding protein HU-beta